MAVTGTKRNTKSRRRTGRILLPLVAVALLVAVLSALRRPEGSGTPEKTVVVNDGVNQINIIPAEGVAISDLSEEDFVSDQRNSAIYGTMQDIMDYVLTHSDWNFDEGELNDFYEESLSNLKEQVRSENGMELDELSDAEIKRFVGADSREALEKFMREQAEPTLASFVWSAVCNGKDPAALSVDEAAELGWDFLEKYVRDSITFEEEER